MRLGKHTTFVFVIFLIGPLATMARADASAEARRLFENVRMGWSAQREAVRSIEYTYFEGMGDASRECRYASDGERFRHASVFRVGGGMARPTETAWDGVKAYVRPRERYLAYSRDKSRARTACPTPEVAILNYYVGPAYGLVQRPNQKYELQDATEEVVDGRKVVTVRLRAQWFKAISRSGTT